jgi:O-antigen biosynthesis protein
MKNQKISVIIPVYNSEKTLNLCLDSFLNQTYKNYEIIVIDNNSTDSSGGIIKNYKNFRYIFEKKKGRSYARNAGIKQASGEIIAMTDSDCVVPKNWIEKITEPIRRGKEAAVLGGEKPISKNFWAKNIQKANQAHFRSLIEGDYIKNIDTKNFAIKSEIIKNNLFNVTLGAAEDFELYLRLRKKIKVKFLPGIQVGHFHPSSFRKIINSSFERGYYSHKVFKKYGKDSDLINETNFTGMHLKNILGYPYRVVYSISKKPMGEVFVLFINAFFWEVGAIYSRLGK